MLMNFHVVDIPESEKSLFGIMPVCVGCLSVYVVCEHNNSQTRRAGEMKFGIRPSHQNRTSVSHFAPNSTAGRLSMNTKVCEHDNFKRDNPEE